MKFTGSYSINNPYPNLNPRVHIVCDSQLVTQCQILTGQLLTIHHVKHAVTLNFGYNELFMLLCAVVVFFVCTCNGNCLSFFIVSYLST